MAIKSVGNVGITFVGIDRSFDVNLGWQTTLTFEGFQAALTSYGAALRNAKIRISPKQGPWYTLAATYGGLQDGSAEIPVDQWEVVTEYEQVDIRSNPNVIAAAGGTDTLALWIKDIKSALDAGTGLSGTVSTQEQAIYDLMSRGVTSNAVKVIVLRRRRTFSLDYITPMVLTAVENIYTTGGLIAAYGIPAGIAGILPPNPGTVPPGCAWSWKERSNNSQIIPAYNRVEELRDWVFLAWSTLLYNAVA